MDHRNKHRDNPAVFFIGSHRLRCSRYYQYKSNGKVWFRSLKSCIKLIFLSGKLQEEDTWFELSPKQQKAFDRLQAGYRLIREQYHALHNLLWLSGHTVEELPKRYQ